MFFANRNTQKNMQFLDKIQTVFTATLGVSSPFICISLYFAQKTYNHSVCSEERDAHYLKLDINNFEGACAQTTAAGTLGIAFARLSC